MQHHTKVILALVAVIIIAAVVVMITAKPIIAPTNSDEVKLANAATTNAVITNTGTGSPLSGPLYALAKARDERRLTDIRFIQSGLEAYRNDQESGVYPLSLAQLAPAYTASVPLDPKTGEGYAYVPVGEGPSSYTLLYTLEIGVQGLAAGQHAASPGNVATP